MFGKRADGYLVKEVDPFIALTPYLMPMRCDAQVMLKFDIEYENLARYIVKKRGEGHIVSFMDVMIAAFVRTVAELPELNRFIVNKRIFARKSLSVSLAILKESSAGKVEENTIKCYFDPKDTVFDVSERMRILIEEARKEDASNASMKIVKFLSKPFLANPIAWFARMSDRYGIMPKLLMEASPFHTSLFLTNMASIGMPSVYHHIYNFGTTTMFWSMGIPKKTVEFDKNGKVTRKRIMPMGVTADERIAPGRVYAMMCARMLEYLKNPEILETPIDKVNYDEGHHYGIPKK